MLRWRFPRRKQSEENDDTSDGESGSSEETIYFDSVEDNHNLDPKSTSSSPTRSFLSYPPLSSAQMIEDAAGGEFIDFNPEENFNQNYAPLASAITQQSPAGKAKESPAYKNDVRMDPSSNISPCSPEVERAMANKVEITQHRFYSSRDWGDVNGEIISCIPDAEQAFANGIVSNTWNPASSLENRPDIKGKRALMFSECRFDANEAAITNQMAHSTFLLHNSQHTDDQFLQFTIDTPWTGSPTKRRRQECYSTPPTPVDRILSQNSLPGFGVCSNSSDESFLDEDLILMDEDYCQDSNPFETPSVPQQTCGVAFADISGQLQDALEFPALSEQAKALGNLDFFTQVFPLLTKLDGRSLEDVYQVGDKRLQNKSHACCVNGNNSESTRNISLEDFRDPGAFFYDCHVDSQGMLRFKITENRQGTTILHRTLGPDKVLRVFFALNFQPDYVLYRRIAETGIVVGCRLYKYFVHVPDEKSKHDKGSKERSTKCYFVCIDSIGERDRKDETFRTFQTIEEARSLFMHIHTCSDISKYIARLKLVFSKTMTVEMPDDLVICVEEDLASKDPAASDALFTDGTGFMSADLAKRIPSDVFKGKVSSRGQRTDDSEDYPCLIQFRFFDHGAAYKGTLLKNDRLPPKTIVLRNSMLKVQRDQKVRGKSIRSFELVSTSRYPRQAKLSQDLISLLSIGGVPDHIFLDAIKHAVNDNQAILHDRRLAHEGLIDWESTKADTTLHMLRAGIPLNEPGLHKALIDLAKQNLQDFSRGKIPLYGTCYLMGTADPSGTLEPDQVVIYKGGGLVCGSVLLYRAPGKHPGDIHKVNAVYNKAVEDIVEYPRNIIFFSVKGDRPLPHAIAGGDLDGDIYWICYNKEVVASFTEYDTRWYKGAVKVAPQNCTILPPKDLSSEDLQKTLFNEFIKDNFHSSFVVGIAAKRWAAHVAAFLHPDICCGEKKIHRKEFLKYVDYVYEGVKKSGLQLILPSAHDIMRFRPKSVIFPMTSIPASEHSSDLGNKSVLRKIYELGEAALGSKWHTPVNKPVDFKPKEVFLVPNSARHIVRWQAHFRNYRKEMSEALKPIRTEKYDPSQPDHVNLKYKQLLFGDASQGCGKDVQTIDEETSAIYEIVYNQAAADCHNGRKPSVAFAWKVAGVVLARIFAEHQPGSRCIFWSQETYNEVHRRHKMIQPGSSLASQRSVEDGDSRANLGEETLKAWNQFHLDG